MKPPLTVAMDGSESAAAAARWAGAMAVTTGDVVRLLHVRPPVDHGPEPTRPRHLDVELEAVEVMARTAEELRRAHPGLPVDTVVEEGDVSETLRRAADRVGTLVLGTRGACRGRAGVRGASGSRADGLSGRAGSARVRAR